MPTFQENVWNTLRNSKMTKIPLEPKNDQNDFKPKNDQNTLET